MSAPLFRTMLLTAVPKSSCTVLGCGCNGLPSYDWSVVDEPDTRTGPKGFSMTGGDVFILAATLTVAVALASVLVLRRIVR